MRLGLQDKVNEEEVLQTGKSAVFFETIGVAFQGLSALGSAGRLLKNATRPAMGAAKAAPAIVKQAKAIAKAGSHVAEEGGWVARNLPTLNKIASTVVHGGLARVSTRAHDLVADVLNRAGFKVCFTGRMQLELSDGSFVAMVDIRPGMRVLSRNEFDPEGIVRAKLVEEVFERWGLVWEVVINGRTVETTAEHPFYVQDRGWVAAHDLAVGDVVRLRDGWNVVEKVCDTGRWERVYNCRVADWHTYFVGGSEWGFSVWAHNEYSAGVETRLRGRLTNAGIDNAVAERIVAYGAAPGVNGDAWAAQWVRGRGANNGATLLDQVRNETALVDQHAFVDLYAEAQGLATPPGYALQRPILPA